MVLNKADLADPFETKVYIKDECCWSASFYIFLTRVINAMNVHVTDF